MTTARRRARSVVGRVAFGLAALIVVVTSARAGAAEPSCPPTGDEVATATRVRTVPVVAGFRFTVAGTEYTTDEAGTVDVSAAAPSCSWDPVQRDVDLGPVTTATFARWFRDTSESTTVTAAFDTTVRVTLHYRDLSGAVVPREDIDRVVLKSSLGNVVEADGTGSVRLPASRVARLSGDTRPGFYVQELHYTVERVDVRGNTVVNRSQNRFSPSVAEVVDVPLIYHGARVQGRDAFFGFPLGTALAVRHPDGLVETHPLDGAATVTLDRLPRGSYEFQVRGPGLSLWRPVTLSRSQALQFAVVSYLDIGVVLVSLGALSLTLLVAGARYRRRVAHLPDEAAPPWVLPVLHRPARPPGGLHREGRRR